MHCGSRKSTLFWQLVGLLLLAAPALAAAPTAFEAELELLRNGKAVGRTKLSFSVENERWTMASNTVGTAGLARLIGLNEDSTSRGDWAGDDARPLSFDRNVKAIKTMRWNAAFDWTNGVVRSVYPDGESELPLEPGVLDETAVGLRIRAGLARGENEWRLRVLDEDEIDDELYRVVASETLTTPLGCVDTRRVDKIRHPDSTRYTRTWYASDHGFVPVRMEHGKTDGDHMESRLVALTIDGQPAEIPPACG